MTFAYCYFPDGREEVHAFDVPPVAGDTLNIGKSSYRVEERVLCPRGTAVHEVLLYLGKQRMVACLS